MFGLHLEWPLKTGFTVITIYRPSILQNGCDVNMKDEDSWTALWHAYSNSDEEIMTLLLKSGADNE